MPAPSRAPRLIRAMNSIDFEKAEERFDAARDFTIGLEELFESRREFERRRIENRELLLESDREVDRALESLNCLLEVDAVHRAVAARRFTGRCGGPLASALGVGGFR